MGAGPAAEDGHVPAAAAAAQPEPADMAEVVAKSARAFAICKAATSAASDSSGAETAHDAGPTWRTLRQSSFASTDTGQQMTPEPEGLARQSVSDVAAAVPAAVATAVTSGIVPQAATLPAATCGMQTANGVSSTHGGGCGGAVRLVSAAVKLEPLPYSGSGGGANVPVVKSEPVSQLAQGSGGQVSQAAAARALSNRQSAARSKERRLAYVVGLEQSVKSLSTQINEQLTHLHSLACNHAALRTANQALHAHATELSNKLAAAEAEIAGLRADRTQLRQTTAAAAADAAPPHSAEAALSRDFGASSAAQHQPAQAGSKHSRSGASVAAAEHNIAGSEVVLPQTLPAQQCPQQPPQQPQQQQQAQQQHMPSVVKTDPMDWEAFMDWGDNSNGSGGGGTAAAAAAGAMPCTRAASRRTCAQPICSVKDAAAAVFTAAAAAAAASRGARCSATSKWHLSEAAACLCPRRQPGLGGNSRQSTP